MKNLSLTSYILQANTGFTVLELVVVLGLIGLLGMIAMPTYNQMRNNVALTQYSNTLIDVLRTAQNQSMVSHGGVTHGVHLAADGNSFVLFGNTWASPVGPVTFKLGNGVKIISPVNTDIVFNRLTGAVAANTVTIGFPSGQQKTITIAALGAVTAN